MAGKPKNLYMQRFGRLTVINDVPEKKNNKIYWMCQCDCGTKKIVYSSSLLSGHTRSCGCLYIESRKALKENIGHKNSIEFSLAAKRHVYRSYQNNAKTKEIMFELSFDEFIFFASMNCHYCNIEPLQTPKIKRNFNGTFYYNGIDRVNNSLGYSTDNVVPCCEICNKAKRDLSYDDFNKWLERVTNFRCKQN